MPDYKLPDVGEGLTEAEIVTWRVQVGDVVDVNDVVVEIETAKSLVELPTPYAGTVSALHVPEGETVAVGTALITIGESAAAPVAPAPVVPEPIAPAPAIDLSNPAATGGGENQTLVGYGPKATSAQRRARRTPTATAAQLQGAFGQGGAGTAPDLDEAAEQATEVALPAVPAADTPEAVPRTLAKPPVRKLAADLGVDLRTLTPTGPGGTVTRQDVTAAASSPPAAELSDPQVALALSRPDNSAARERREPVRGVRKQMASAMVTSAFTAPHVTEWVTVDATRTTRLVERLKEHRNFRDVRVSPLLLVAKAVCLAARRTPEINASWDEDRQEVVLKDYVHLGIAAATPRGLVVPNVRDADAMSLSELARALDALTRTAREGRTQPAEMTDGSFTITNVGVFGVDAGTPIINPGESAILCLGAIKPRPWVHNGKIKVRQVTTLALSFDHRIVDGEQGSRFLADVAAVLEDPASALLL